MAENMKKFCHQLLSVLVLAGGLACTLAAFTWVGCATNPDGSSRYRPSYESRYAYNTGLTKDARLKERIYFLTESNVSVAEVNVRLGIPDWQSKELRLLAYRVRKDQVLFITYGVDNLVTRHELLKFKPADSLSEAAITWQTK